MRCALVVAVTLLGLILTVAAESPADPLDKVVGMGYSYNSFKEAIQQIESKTGFKTHCSKELAEFMQSRFMGVRVWDTKNPGPKPQETARAFLNQICGQIYVDWKFDPSSNTVHLDLPWKTSDLRSPVELLKVIRETAFSGNSETEAQWLMAFNALLSSPANIDQAWQTRQAAALEQFPLFPRSLKPAMIKPVISTTLHNYLMVLFNQQIRSHPGHGSVSYYCFKEDGTLAVAGLLNTGHRCTLVDTTVDNEFGSRSESPSEIHMILKMNLRDFFVARFHLDEKGLELFSLVDGHGDRVNNDGLGVGVSLLND